MAAKASITVQVPDRELVRVCAVILRYQHRALLITFTNGEIFGYVTSISFLYSSANTASSAVTSEHSDTIRLITRYFLTSFDVVTIIRSIVLLLQNEVLPAHYVLKWPLRINSSVIT